MKLPTTPFSLFGRLPRPLVKLLLSLAGLFLLAVLVLISSHFANRRWRASVWTTYEDLKRSVDAGPSARHVLLQRPTHLSLTDTGAVSLYFAPPWYAWEAKLLHGLEGHEILEIRLDPPRDGRGWLIRFPGPTD